MNIKHLAQENEYKILSIFFFLSFLFRLYLKRVKYLLSISQYHNIEISSPKT